MPKESVQYFFNESRGYLKGTFGLSLTLIELVHLRNVVIQCYSEHNEYEINHPDKSPLDIKTEAAVRFIWEGYGIAPYALIDELYAYAERPMDMHLQFLQARMHMP